MISSFGILLGATAKLVVFGKRKNRNDGQVFVG